MWRLFPETQVTYCGSQHTHNRWSGLELWGFGEGRDEVCADKGGDVKIITVLWILALATAILGLVLVSACVGT